MVKSYTATRMYMAPLSPAELDDKDLVKLLRMSQKKLLDTVRKHLMQATFSEKAKKALSDSMKVEMRAKSVVVTVNHPSFFSLVLGRRKRQMRWLMKATKPIPIVTESGKVIFRNATARSMRNPPMTGPNVGKNPVGWIHPGRPKADFVQEAKKEASKFLRARIGKMLASTVKSSWMRKSRLR